MEADNSVEAIKALEGMRYQAMLSGDYAGLDRLCSEKLIYSHSRGERDTKVEYVRKVRDRIYDYLEISHSEDHIALLGDAAVVWGRMSARVAVAGDIKVINNFSLAVWARAAGVWQLVAYQPTPSPAAAAGNRESC